MNKTTVPLFISGVLVGFGLCLMLIKKDSAPPKVAAPLISAPVAAPRLEKLPAVAQAEPQPKTPPVAESRRLLDADPVAFSRSIPPQPAKDSQIDVDISDDDVAAIEENMPELRQDVRVYPDERGWLVRFYKPDNALASIGVRDNDLIRYEQFELMKKDPNKEKLVGRLEGLLKELAH